MKPEFKILKGTDKSVEKQLNDLRKTYNYINVEGVGESGDELVVVVVVIK
jgi:hypothetical protein